MLDLFIPASCLHGYDPSTFPRLGFTYRINRPENSLTRKEAAADIYSPVTGQIIAINEKLLTDPSLLTQDPENEGWLFEIVVKDLQEPTLLMSQEEYTAMLQG